MIDKEILHFIKEHEKDNVHTLALQAERYKDVNMPFVINQISGRQVSREKIPVFYKNDSVIYPKHISLEQCSSQQTALYKAQLCDKGKTIVDLTGGFGVDFYFMSQKFSESIYVEKSTALSELAKYNFEILGLTNFTVANNSAEEYLQDLKEADTIYIDPSRRNSLGRKTFLIEDCSPDLVKIQNALNEKSRQLIIKLSPMLDIKSALNFLKIINEVHIISVNNECKELLFVKKSKNSFKEIQLHCINIRNNQTIDSYTSTIAKEEAVSPVYTSQIKEYIYEPNASIMKAGAYKSISIDFKLEKLHPNSHLYTSDKLIRNFPGRIFKFDSAVNYNKKEIKKILQETDKANITVRNFPAPVEQIRKKTSLKEGGDIYIFATTLADEAKVLIICRKIP